MKETLQATGGRVWSEFKGFTSGQKAITIAAVLALAVGGYLFATWKAKPTYAPLYTNLAASDASAIVDKLNSAGTPYQLGAGGTEILVPQDKVYSARLAISAAGLPSSSQTGFPLLNKEGVTTSQFQQQIAYQADLENQLDSTLDAINGVQSAKVSLSIPQDTVFTDSTSKPTASVLLSVTGGTTLTTSQVQSVVYLVASSVPGLTSDNVTVADSNGNVLNAPGQGLGGAATNATQQQATAAAEASLTSKIQSMLDAQLGPGNAQVSVNTVLNFDQSSTTTKNYTYDKNNPPVSEQSSSTVYAGNGSPASGTLGSTSSTSSTGAVDTTASGSASNGNYKQSSVTVNNALGTTETDTTKAPGSIQQQNVAVEVNKNAKNVDVTAIEAMVKAAAGYNATRGDQVTVQSVAFDGTQAATDKAAQVAATKAAASTASQAKLIGMAKQGGLALLILGVVFWAWRSGRKRRKRPAVAEEADGWDLLPISPSDDGPLGPPMEQLTHKDPAADRNNLVTAADNRPEDFARALSGWLNSRENA